jgi:hypothetical protein
MRTGEEGQSGAGDGRLKPGDLPGHLEGQGRGPGDPQGKAPAGRSSPQALRQARGQFPDGHDRISSQDVEAIRGMAGPTEQDSFHQVIDIDRVQRPPAISQEDEKASLDQPE